MSRIPVAFRLICERRRAIEQMRTFHPEEHEESRSVAPLLQFFELVHVGDTMQSMVQVYFDKELVRASDDPRPFCAQSILLIRHLTSTVLTSSIRLCGRRSALRTRWTTASPLASMLERMLS